MQVEKLTGENKEIEERLRVETETMQEEVNQLSKDLELNQINLMMEIDKNAVTVDELSREIVRLRV